MEFRRYVETDYNALCDFLIELNRADCTHINWNWARFEWMYGHPEFDLSAICSIGLWFDGERIVGAAIYDMYFGEAFCGVLPGYEAQYAAVLQYAYMELKDDAGLGIAVCDENGAEIAAAAAEGFAAAEQDETIMSMDLSRSFRAGLPEGLHFEEIGPGTDEKALAWFFWQGFDHGSDRSEFEQSGQTPPRARVHFDQRLSVGAVTEDGELVSYCCLWFCSGTDYAYVEPVCTVPAWRGKGAARAVIFEALGRAAALGAKKAYVISDLAFYEKLGFRKELHYTFYRKNTADS
ncbi:MAG: GNAT family N-acetyltransferase [Clostridia bacterium]|nr:GNAT family N-acetyltransferase [Clostridia bacterium]